MALRASTALAAALVVLALAGLAAPPAPATAAGPVATVALVPGGCLPRAVHALARQRVRLERQLRHLQRRAGIARTSPRARRTLRRHAARLRRALAQVRLRERRCRAARAAVARRSVSELRLSPQDAGTVALAWPAVPGAARQQVYRDGRLLDDVPAGDPAYVDRGLWPSTSYAYSVRVLDAAGGQLARYDDSTATPARGGSFPRLYADSSPLNAPVGGAPVDPGSSAMVARSIVPYAGSANLTNSPDWGIPIFQADSSSQRQSVGCTRYWCNVAVPPFPIPAAAQPSSGSDGHLVVLDGAGGELDAWTADHGSDGWSAGVRGVTSSQGSGLECDRGQTCGRANAAGFALAAGIVRPEEIAQGHIDHALVITTPYTRSGYVACPALGTDGSSDDPAALPEGARLQLDPSVDVDALPIPGWQKVLARALQTYGAYVVDTGGSLSIRAESNLGRGYDAWAKAGVPDFPNLSGLPWGSLRVMQLTRC
jgi:hypothetical protein